MFNVYHYENGLNFCIIILKVVPFRLTSISSAEMKMPKNFQTDKGCPSVDIIRKSRVSEALIAECCSDNFNMNASAIFHSLTQSMNNLSKVRSILL